MPSYSEDIRLQCEKYQLDRVGDYWFEGKNCAFKQHSIAKSDCRKHHAKDQCERFCSNGCLALDLLCSGPRNFYSKEGSLLVPDKLTLSTRKFQATANIRDDEFTSHNEAVDCEVKKFEPSKATNTLLSCGRGPNKSDSSNEKIQISPSINMTTYPDEMVFKFPKPINFMGDDFVTEPLKFECKKGTVGSGYWRNCSEWAVVAPPTEGMGPFECHLMPTNFKTSAQKQLVEGNVWIKFNPK